MVKKLKLAKIRNREKKEKRKKDLIKRGFFKAACAILLSSIIPLTNGCGEEKKTKKEEYKLYQESIVSFEQEKEIDAPSTTEDYAAPKVYNYSVMDTSCQKKEDVELTCEKEYKGTCIIGTFTFLGENGDFYKINNENDEGKRESIILKLGLPFGRLYLYPDYIKTKEESGYSYILQEFIPVIKGRPQWICKMKKIGEEAKILQKENGDIIGMTIDDFSIIYTENEDKKIAITQTYRKLDKYLQTISKKTFQNIKLSYKEYDSIVENWAESDKIIRFGIGWEESESSVEPKKINIRYFLDKETKRYKMIYTYQDIDGEEKFQNKRYSSLNLSFYPFFGVITLSVPLIDSEEESIYIDVNIKNLNSKLLPITGIFQPSIGDYNELEGRAIENGMVYSINQEDDYYALLSPEKIFLGGEISIYSREEKKIKKGKIIRKEEGEYVIAVPDENGNITNYYVISIDGWLLKKTEFGWYSFYSRALLLNVEDGLFFYGQVFPDKPEENRE